MMEGSEVPMDNLRSFFPSHLSTEGRDDRARQLPRRKRDDEVECGRCA